MHIYSMRNTAYTIQQTHKSLTQQGPSFTVIPIGIRKYIMPGNNYLHYHSTSSFLQASTPDLLNMFSMRNIAIEWWSGAQNNKNEQQGKFSLCVYCLNLACSGKKLCNMHDKPRHVCVAQRQYIIIYQKTY